MPATHLPDWLPTNVGALPSKILFTLIFLQIGLWLMGTEHRLVSGYAEEFPQQFTAVCFLTFFLHAGFKQEF